MTKSLIHLILKKITIMKKVFLSLFSFSLLLVSCGGGSEETTTEETTTEETTEEVVEEIIEDEVSNYPEGEEIYNSKCLACHQPNGEGIAGTFPPLANSDYMLEDKNRAIEQVLNGSEGEITVNGEVYNGVMPPQAVTDQEAVDVLNYVLNSWGNEGGEVTLEEVEGAKHPE